MRPKVVILIERKINDLVKGINHREHRGGALTPVLL